MQANNHQQKLNIYVSSLKKQLSIPHLNFLDFEGN